MFQQLVLPFIKKTDPNSNGVTDSTPEIEVLKLSIMSKEKEEKGKSDKKIPVMNLKEKRADKAAKRFEKTHVTID